ncbi:unnamed protein product [Menidia menidia]|uniref:(Atlantic silverside) hypothetical protein n=1 Tax=Menidia menidia TaxID=238744 RepID=A0A8S4BRI0_9TELE|nr:unnamed protein product [Menidia menidia]
MIALKLPAPGLRVFAQQHVVPRGLQRTVLPGDSYHRMAPSVSGAPQHLPHMEPTLHSHLGPGHVTAELSRRPGHLLFAGRQQERERPSAGETGKELRVSARREEGGTASREKADEKEGLLPDARLQSQVERRRPIWTKSCALNHSLRSAD